VVAAEIVNYTVTGTRRLDINLAVSYCANAETVLAIMEKAAAQPAVLQEPAPVFAMKEYNEQSITYGMMLWCNTADYWDLKFAVNRELDRLAQDRGIRFYAPQLSVKMEK
jgi:small conductance mechanosensitive channel